MHNYSLTILGGNCLSLEDSTNSSEKMLSGIYEEFKNLSHVNIKNIKLTAAIGKNYIDFFNNFEKSDFVLINFYTSFSIVKNIELIKPKIKYEVCSFIEHPQKNMDYTFGFLKKFKPDCYIPYPYSKKFIENKNKVKKTILLDDCINNKHDCSKIIGEYTKELVKEGYKIYQLTNKNTVCDHIEPIFKDSYKKYMDKTCEIETFIQTHPGSYEHSIIDMLARGIRVLVPKNMSEFNRCFIPEETIEDFKIKTFSEKEELIQLIKEDINRDQLNSNINKMTEMKDIVKKIDGYFQHIIEVKNVKKIN